MEQLTILWKQLWNAVTESVKKPWSSKWRHFKYRLAWEWRPFMRDAGKFPLAVDVELCSYCNFRCGMCQQSSNWWNKEGKTISQSFMEWPIFKKIVNECVALGVHSMKVNWRGEPMANPVIYKYIRYMKAKGIHEVMMNTNASYLTVRNADALIRSGLDRIIFSCDGLSKSTYNSIRIGGDFDKFMQKIKMFKKRCISHDKLGRSTPIIRINMSFQEKNAHEIPHAKEYFKDIADELRINTVYNPQKESTWLGAEHRTVKRKGCSQLYQRLVISCEGDIVPCCADYKKQLSVGNVKKVSLREAYTRKIQAIRNTHERHRGRTLDGCTNCDLFALSIRDVNGKVIYA